MLEIFFIIYHIQNPHKKVKVEKIKNFKKSYFYILFSINYSYKKLNENLFIKLNIL
jgi:hypothetical protein